MNYHSRLTRRVLAGLVLGVAAVGSALIFSAWMGPVAASNPELRPLVTPLVVLGSAFVTCSLALLLVALQVVRAKGEARLDERLRGARGLIALTLLLVAIDICIIVLVFSSGFTPGTLFILYGIVVMGLLAAASIGAYIANFTRRWKT